MPEATVNEHGKSAASEDDIGTNNSTVKSDREIDAKSESQAMQG